MHNFNCFTLIASVAGKQQSSQFRRKEQNFMNEIRRKVVITSTKYYVLQGAVKTRITNSKLVSFDPPHLIICTLPLKLHVALETLDCKLYFLL